MDREKIMERILKWQILADRYSNDNTKVFIKTISGNFHFCKIVLVGETKLTVDNYGPDQRAGTRDIIDWLQIETFEEVRDNGN